MNLNARLSCESLEARENPSDLGPLGPLPPPLLNPDNTYAPYIPPAVVVPPPVSNSFVTTITNIVVDITTPPPDPLFGTSPLTGLPLVPLP